MDAENLDVEHQVEPQNREQEPRAGGHKRDHAGEYPIADDGRPASSGDPYLGNRGALEPRLRGAAVRREMPSRASSVRRGFSSR